MLILSSQLNNEDFWANLTYEGLYVQVRKLYYKRGSGLTLSSYHLILLS